jgi:hypothetical protein
VTPYITAGAGFLLAVLWFDLMFDIQVLGHESHELPEPVLLSIATYYRRVTTTARPMNRLVAAAMVVTLGSIIAQIIRGDAAPWVSWFSLLLVVGPILLAALRTVPNAVRLGARSDTARRQSTLARSICRDHVLCMAGILALLGVQLSAG